MQVKVLQNAPMGAFCNTLDLIKLPFEPVHEISNNTCATSKASDQPALMRSLIRALASRLSIL